MVTTLYLIRHGETEGADTKRYKGSIDVPLSENGIQQIKKTSAFIMEHIWNSASSKYLPAAGNDMDIKLHAVYCSNLGRAVKSAEIIAEPYGLYPVKILALRERNFGIWEGMNFDEIREKYPPEFESWANNPLKYSPMGGESTLEVRERVINALDEIIENHNEERIAIVAHGGVNRIVLCHLLGIPLENIFRIEQDYAALNIIEFWDKYPVVKLING